MAKKKVAKVVVKKKRWVTVLAPKLFNERDIGEMHVEDPQSAVGRKLTVSMATITGEPRKQNTMVKFLISRFAGEKLMTEIIGYRLNTAATKRMIRRNRSKIDDSIVYKTADEKKVRVKPMIITRNKMQSGAKGEIRRLMKDFLAKNIVKLNYEQLMREIVLGKFQKAMHETVKKLCPLAGSEIKNIELIMPKKIS